MGVRHGLNTDVFGSDVPATVVEVVVVELVVVRRDGGRVVDVVELVVVAGRRSWSAPRWWSARRSAWPPW